MRLRVGLGLLLLAVAAGGGLVMRCSGIASLRDPFAALGDPAGPTALAAFLLIQVAVAAFGFLPASFAAIAAGATFGVGRGFVASACGTMLGGWIAFALARSLLRPLIARLVARHPSFARFEANVAAGDWKVVCLIRMSPVMPFALTSYGLGLTRIGHRPFLAGMLASMPSLLCYVAIGALGKAGLAIGRSRVDMLHGLVLVLGAAATALLAVKLGSWLRASLAPAAADAA